MVPTAEECLVCQKHAAADPGIEVHRDDLVYVGHLPATPEAYLGHLFVEPREHVPGLADLGSEQAAAVGEAMRRTSVALRADGHDHVYAFVFGDRVPHLHVHLLGRYPGAPEESAAPASMSGRRRRAAMRRRSPSTSPACVTCGRRRVDDASGAPGHPDVGRLLLVPGTVGALDLDEPTALVQASGAEVGLEDPQLVAVGVRGVDDVEEERADPLSREVGRM